MGVIADISKALLSAIKLALKTAAARKREALRVERMLSQLRAELFANRDSASGLLQGGKLGGLKANDPAWAKTLARFKTAAMAEVSGCPRAYRFKPSPKAAAFLDLLSLTLHKIDALRKLSAMGNKELAQYPKARLAVRVKHLSRCLEKLVKQA